MSYRLVLTFRLACSGFRHTCTYTFTHSLDDQDGKWHVIHCSLSQHVHRLLTSLLVSVCFRGSDAHLLASAKCTLLLVGYFYLYRCFKGFLICSHRDILHYRAEGEISGASRRAPTRHQQLKHRTVGRVCW